MVGEDVRAVKVHRKLVQDLLDKAAEVKQSSAIGSPLTEDDLGDAISRILAREDDSIKGQSAQTQYAAVETAFREKFYDLLVLQHLPTPRRNVLTWHIY